jgi:hypothetical protein
MINNMGEKMSYSNIDRGWELLRKAMKEGNERDRENWRNIMGDIRRSGKTYQTYVSELCEKNRRNNEEKFRKLDDSKTDDLERAIILCEYLGIAIPLALTGYVYNPFNKKRKR